ncbi:MAG: hypothetical protein AB7K09_20230 [Planctomycetota bacterium]
MTCRLPLLLPAIVVSLLALIPSAGCSSGYQQRELTPEERSRLDALADQHRDAARWRMTDLPELLDHFGTDNPAEWREARDRLLSPRMETHTPSIRMDGNQKRSTYIRERLEAHDWDTARSRRWLVRQGYIYRQLAVFHDPHSRPEDWAKARKALQALTDADRAEVDAAKKAGKPDDRTSYEKADVPTERMAFELVLKLMVPPDNQEAESNAQHHSFTVPQAGTVTNAQGLFNVAPPSNANWLANAQGNTLGPQSLQIEDRSLWAVEQLVELREDAIAPVIWGTWLSDSVGSERAAEGVRFYELLYLALARMDELPVPALLIDLDNSRKLESAMWRYHRVRRLVRTLGEIYGPESFSVPERVKSAPVRDANGNLIDQPQVWVIQRDRFRPDWQESATHRDEVLAAIANVMRTFRAANDDLLFQMRNYCVDALVEIGDPAACAHLVDLWEVADKEGEEYLVSDIIRPGLVRLSGRNYRTIAEWRKWLAERNK